MISRKTELTAVVQKLKKRRLRVDVEHGSLIGDRVVDLEDYVISRRIAS